jgi:hypothetical protein
MPSLEQGFDRAKGLHSAIIRDWACLHQNLPEQVKAAVERLDAALCSDVQSPIN